MSGQSRGFTLIELMIVVVVIGILAAIAIPNFSEMHKRALESSTKMNMHTLQMSVEDYGVQNDGSYPDAIDATHVTNSLPGNFANPYTGVSGSGAAWEDRAVYAAGPSPIPGIASYADSLTTTYNVKGYGTSAALALTLNTGQP